MDEKTNAPKKKVKVILRPSPLSLKILLIVLILVSMGALIALRWVTNSIRDIAREELDLVDPDTIIIEPKSE